MFSIFQRSKAAPGLSAAEAVRLAATGALTVIDVREAAEVSASGKAAGSRHVPLAFVPLRCDPRSPDFIGLDPAKPLAVYCASGARSGRAADILRGFGFAEVHNIGGLRDWVEAGGKLERQV